MCYRKGLIIVTISFRLNNEDSDLLKSYAAIKGVSVSEFVRKTVLEKIEDEFDLKAYEKAMAEYKANPIEYDFMEVAKELDLL